MAASCWVGPTAARSLGDAIEVASVVGKDGSASATGSRSASTAPYAKQFPAVTGFGSQALVTWTDNRGLDTSVFAARVDAAGNVLDTDDRGSRTRPLPGMRSRVRPSNGTDALVVWEAAQHAKRGVFGALVHADGTVGAPFVVSDPDGSQQRPTVAWNDRAGAFVVVWYDDRSGAGTDIYGARVAPDGTVLDPDGVALVTGMTGNRWRSPRRVRRRYRHRRVYQDNSSGDWDIAAGSAGIRCPRGDRAAGAADGGRRRSRVMSR